MRGSVHDADRHGDRRPLGRRRARAGRRPLRRGDRSRDRRRVRVADAHVIAAVVFDCDGTLVNSEPLARQAWERSLAPHGYAIRDDEYARLVGLPYERVHAFFAERIPGLEEPGVFWDAYSGTLFELIDSALEPFGDALETMRGVRSAGL